MAKRKFSKEQSNYMVAQANLQVLEAQNDANDLQYIKVNNIVNEDGSIPTMVYMIDDEETFDKANIECSKISEDNGLWNKILVARELFKTAENELIKYSLSIMPASLQKERLILEKSASENYTTRLKLIELVMKLDPTSVPA